MNVSAGPAVLLINNLGVGGAERAVRAVAIRFRALGRNVRLVCLESPDSSSAAEVDFPADSLSHLHTSASSFLKFAYLPLLAIRLTRYLSKNHADTVMSHLFRANFVNVLARTLAGSRHKAVLVNHTRLGRLSAEGAQGRITWLLCRLLYRKADLVGSVSTGAARECERLLDLPAGKSITLYDPVSVSASPLGGKSPGEPRIIAVGRLVPLKRFQDLIHAFAGIAADFPELTLNFVGEGRARDELEHCAEEAKIEGRVHFLGWMADPSKAVRGAKVFVSTSETEGFGMAIVEALAAGVPVVASDCAFGPREILSPATNSSELLPPGSGIEVAPFGILYPVGSVDALENALRRLIVDSTLSKELERKGPGRASDFSIERSTAAYEKILFE